MTEQIKSEIRKYLVGQRLSESGNKGYVCASSSDEIPEAYGDYFIYYGTNLGAAGASRNLRGTFAEHFDSRRDLGMFFWKLDLDGSTEKWLDGEHEVGSGDQDDDSGLCPECGAQL